MRRILAMIGLALAAAPAAAQTDIEAEHYLISRLYSQCALTDFRVRHRGALEGLAEPAAVATFFVDGCLGPSRAIRGVVVFLQRNGEIVALQPRLPEPLLVETAQVEEGRVLAHGLRWGPRDQPCCPSLRVTARLVVRDGELVLDGPLMARRRG